MESKVEYATSYRSLTEAVTAVGERSFNLNISNEQLLDADLTFAQD